MKIGMRPVLAGTDARGFQLPPDGSHLVSMLKDSSVAGMDPLGFRHPPDGLLFGLKLLLRGSGEEDVPPGTDKRCFRGPPDWMERESRTMKGEARMFLGEDECAAGAGTDEWRF